MSYWKWLRQSIKAAASWKSVKNTMRAPYMELSGGFAVGFGLLLSGLAYGASDNHLYYLLLLGLIPAILIMLHGHYRGRVRI